MYKFLILLKIFLSASVLAAEPIVPDEEINTVLIRIQFFNTKAELVEWYNNAYPNDPEDETLEGFSICERILPRDFPGEEDVVREFAECWIYQVRPTAVDGEHTLTLGHEVLHGVYGPTYHKPVE